MHKIHHSPTRPPAKTVFRPLRHAMRGIRWHGLTASLVLALALMGAGGARADDYRLAPGDVIALDIGGIAQFAATAEVANDGTVTLPRFGRVDAAGKTVEEVQEAVRAKVDGTVFRRFDLVGQVAYLDVTPEDVFIDVEAYRDVSVIGLVAAPGPVPFRSGLSVRAAIAAAGGIPRDTGAAMGQTDISGLAGQLTHLGQMRRERAQVMAELWRLRDELQGETPPPDAGALGIAAAEAEAVLALQRRLREVNEQNLEKALNELDTLEHLSERRSELLQRQQKNQAEGVRADEADLARLRSLKSQGLVPNDQIRTVRRLQTLSTTQFLDTSNELERLQIELARLKSERRRLQSTHTQDRLQRIIEAQADLARLNSAIEGLELGMGLTGATGAGTGDEGDMRVDAVIHRGVGPDAQGRPVNLDTLVQPGDVVEIRLDWSAPEQQVTQ